MSKYTEILHYFEPDELKEMIMPGILSRAGEFKIKYLCFDEKNSAANSAGDQNLEIHCLDGSNSFEGFIYQIYQLIHASRQKSVYVFACLADQPPYWASEMMMDNLYKLLKEMLQGTGSTGYFPVVKALPDWNKLPREDRSKICQRLMTGEAFMNHLIVEHFDLEDYTQVLERMIGSGKIGGKACGFLLGNKLIRKYLPHLAGEIAGNDSFFIGTDVFYTYLIDNNCWKYRLQQRQEKEYFEAVDEFREKLQSGDFPLRIRAQLRKMLEYYGTDPIIIRSSSIMEDGYGNAFSGKYESIFCANQGTLERRLEEAENAIRAVYASTLSNSALEYRKKRDLFGQDEQMALLVQRVAGTRAGSYYFPLAAGVSFSHNPYRWMEEISPEAGMVRLVAGLGTRAVNRTPGDYPRLIGLDRPQALLWATTKDRHKFSQRYIDVLNLTTGKMESLPWSLMNHILPKAYKKLIFSHDTDAEYLFREQGQHREILFVDCQGIVNNLAYIEMMRSVLKVLQDAYSCPVDIEFALNLDENNQIIFELLQCRPLKYRESMHFEIKPHRDSEILFKIKRASIRSNKEESIDMIVMVDPKAYYETEHNRKSTVAAIIGRINKQIKDKKAILFVPGRIGTSSPELGVPVSYAEISNFTAICEVAYHDAGYRPELSYGSHMFQDLVEAEIFYAAINEDRNTVHYHPEMLKNYENIYDELVSTDQDYRDVVSAYSFNAQDVRLYLDAAKGHASCIIHDA